MKIVYSALLLTVVLILSPHFPIKAADILLNPEQDESLETESSDEVPEAKSESSLEDEIIIPPDTASNDSDLQYGQEQIVSLLEAIRINLEASFGELRFWLVATAAWWFAKKSWRGVE